MALIAHKYMPAEMPERELKATFAAREHTLDYLVKSIAGQTPSEHLTSFLITGPRGSGKTTLVLMLRLAIKENPDLSRHWLPALFPEELPAIGSLRDLLSAALQALAEEGLAEAIPWREKVEAEQDDRASEDLAIRALEEISKQQGKRLILLIENLDMVFARGLDDRTQKTLRRLLMTRPFMMIIGTAVRMFEELERYDAALFNYFCPVPLKRLGDEEVERLLRCRAEFDGGDRFAEEYRKHRPKIRAISKLTGGNPRLVLMLYEVLMHGDMTSTVGTLRQLIDELTPLLKDVLEHQMSDQQAKIVDALMRAGGVATPSQLATATRLSLNSVTTQLKRLLDAQVVELRGGGKGRPAYYSVADQLFCTWYQMRYLRPGRRRIEMFVEIYRVWYEVEDRWAALSRIMEAAKEGSTEPGRAATAEYLAASLADTDFADQARDLAVAGWLRSGQLQDAAQALAEFATSDGHGGQLDDAAVYENLSRWSIAREDLPTTVAALSEALQRDPKRSDLKVKLGWALGCRGDYDGAIGRLTEALADESLEKGPRTLARFYLGLARLGVGDSRTAAGEFPFEVLSVSESGHVREQLNQRDQVVGIGGGFPGSSQLELVWMAVLVSLFLYNFHQPAEISNPTFRWFLCACRKIPQPDRSALFSAFFSVLPRTEHRSMWLELFHLVQERHSTEALEGLEWLQAVARRLEDGDESALDRLTTHERDLAKRCLDSSSRAEGPWWRRSIR